MKILVASHKIQLLSFQATRSLVLFVLPHYERVKSTRIRWKSDFHLPRPEVELNFSIEPFQKPKKSSNQGWKSGKELVIIKHTRDAGVIKRRRKSCFRSSAGQSTALLRRVSGVRIASGTPYLKQTGSLYNKVFGFFYSIGKFY